MNLLPESEQQLLNVLRSIDFANKHEEVRIIGSEKSIGVHIKHKGSERVDVEVFPTIKTVKELQIFAQQGEING